MAVNVSRQVIPWPRVRLIRAMRSISDAELLSNQIKTIKRLENLVLMKCSKDVASAKQPKLEACLRQERANLWQIQGKFRYLNACLVEQKT